MALPAEFAIKKPLLRDYELFPAKYMPFTDPFPCQKGFVTSYEFSRASYMAFTGPILYHKLFDTP